MKLSKDRLVFSGVKGRNGGVSPIELAEDECAEAYNVDFYAGALCRKRRGSLEITMTGGPGVATYAAIPHIPSGLTEADMELFAIGLTGGVVRFRKSGGNYSWTTPTTADAASVTSGAADNPRLDGASLNGKCFLPYYASGVNRLHCWDGTSVRRVGLVQGGTAPTVANTGAGAYAATLRYYRTAWADIVGSTHNRRSELSSSVSFTPSGAGTAARVTRPTAPGEGETHWLLYASPDDVYSNYHLIAITAIATTTFDDTFTPSAYTGNPPQTAGLNIPPPSTKYIITDGNRLLTAGAYESSAGTGETEPKHSRVWFTRVLGSSGIGDDESIPNTSAVGITPAQKNWIDVGENDGGGRIQALAIINGVIFVFKRWHIYRLVPTGDDLAPYRALLVSNAVGCVFRHGVVVAEDADGEPVLYFTNQRGVYRLTIGGDIDLISRPIDDIFSSAAVTAALFHSQRNQVWVGTGSAVAVYDVSTGGWSRYVFTGSGVTAMVMFPELQNSAGSFSQTESGDRKPLLFDDDADCAQCDDDTVTTDPGGNFQAYITSRPYFPASAGNHALVHDAVLAAKAASGVTITATVSADFGLRTQTGTVSLTAAGSETRIVRRIEETAMGEVAAVQYTLGDGSAASNYWELDALTVPAKVQESLS